MDIFVSNNKLKRAVEDASKCRLQYGTDLCEKLSLRVATLRGAESLADFWPPNSGPERCHELKGELKGLFSVDLKHPYRLLFEPIDLAKEFADETARWKAITRILLLDVKDTHG